MIKKKLKVNRGVAIPLGNDYFLMRGATHEQGGIDVGKDLEVENGEIIKVNPKSIKILSNAPIMNGISPAQMALGGLNNGTFKQRFDKGFNYQEKFKDINGLKDDGTKAQMGRKKKLIGGDENEIDTSVPFLTREEYIKQQRQSIIDKSLENSNNRRLPTVPFVLRETKKQWEEYINNLIEVAKSKLNDAIQYNHGEHIVKGWRDELDRLIDKLNKGYKEELCAGNSCIYTATDNYGKKYRVSGNKSFRANPAKYGFEEINLNDIKPGDIIQDFSLGYPSHALTFINYDNEGKALFNYSKGGSTEEDIVKNAHYSFYDDGHIHLNNKDNSNLRTQAAAYRFIGTEDDNKLWNENYNKERSNFAKQVVEELKQVPTIKLPNRVVSMNGISPAQMALGGLGSSNFEQRFNKSFRYQESYKKKNKLNDDGTKKAKFGKNKKLIGGEENKVPEFKLGELPNAYQYYEEPFGQYTLHHTTPNPPYRPLEQEYAFNYISDDIENGEAYLYDKDRMKNDLFYKDKEGNYFSYYYQNDGIPNPDIYTEVPYSEIRKMLPKRDYIGGSKREVGIKVINKVPGLKDEILRLSKVYGISPNVFTNRLINEGWIQGIAYEYNTTYPKYQKEYDWSDVMKRTVSGYGQLGLDTFGNYDKEGKLNLRRPIQYEDSFNTNEDKTGREYNSAYFNNAYDALEAKAAMLEYFTKVAKQRNVSESDLDAYVNAMYNMGEYHKDLNNMDYVRREYGFEPYYKLGGEIKNKSNKRGISSTGGKKKAFLGDVYPLSDAVVTTKQNKLPDLNWIGFKPKKQRIIVPKLNTNGIYNLGEFPTLDVPKYLEAPTGGLAIHKGYYKNGLKIPDSNVGGKISIFKANPNLAGNIVQGVANIGAATISGLVNREMLNDLQYRPRPTLLQAGKLKTNFNINPQVREIKNTLDEYRRLIDKNTASSQVALARNRHGYVDALESLLGLRGQKENIETQLINQDILNQQEIANKNIINYDNWLAGKYDFDNAIREKRSENVISGIQTGTQALSDFITNNAKWRNTMANIAALSAAYPNVTPERMAASGVYYPLYIKQRIAKGKRR